MFDILDLNVKENEIHIWSLSLNGPLYTGYKRYLKYLTPIERSRANSIIHEHKKISYIVSHFYLRYLICSYLGLGFDDWTFNYNLYGKPFVPMHDLSFNMSHSGGKVVFSFSKNVPLGVDIEQIKKLMI